MQTVERGAALLDERVPGWEELIDLNTLDLSSTCRCVLGQLYLAQHPQVRMSEERYEAYDQELQALDLPDHEARRYGFMPWGPSTYENLTTAWRGLIHRRQTA